ncbi:hypothetical protein HYC85_001294 [Camellia sinensis]|uniref:Uncharacterized protein n=1 Tax=Camellia sinensis TaxID=4442 RepID=A0A7J7I5L1_CAMSI|nr:hypothetical protein HYC85_001294 [Camellia sinensis]
MDYPLPRRTRLQKALFYKEFNEKKKKQKKADGGSGGGLNLGFGGGGGSDVDGEVESTGGVNFGSFQKNESLGIMKVQNLKKGMRKDQNFDKPSVGSKENKRYSQRLKNSKNVIGMGLDDDDGESDNEVQIIGMKDKDGRVVEDSVGLNDGEKSCGLSSQVRSQLKKEVIDVVSIDLEVPSESDGDSESNGNAKVANLGKRRRICGLDILVDCEKELGEEEIERPTTMAERVRLRHVSKSTKSEKKIQEFGVSESNGNAKVAHLGQLSSCSLDDEGKERSIEGGLKRRRICGLDILVDCEKEDGVEEIEKPKTVAERVHLRHVSKSTKSEKKKQKFGTFSCPFTLTGDDFKTGLKNCNDGKYVWKAGENGEESEEEVMWPAKRKRNAVDSAVPISVDKILADSIWEKGDVPLENLVPSEHKVPDQEATLPLKFSFGFEDEDQKPPEKSYWEIEADKLFAERDFVLATCEIGSSDSFMVDNEDSITQDAESDPATCCCQGRQQLVLDEQIGLKCKFCSFVKLEIKHILPSFSKHPWGRRTNKKNLGSTDHFNLDDLQFQDSAPLYQSSSKRHAYAKSTVWDIIPGVKDSMYPHQREGFEFIWKNIAGGMDLEELKNKNDFDGGSGCIISHAPGTGKTRLTIVFLQTYMALYRSCRPVIIAPSSMLLTWEEEFRKWNVDIPFHNLNKLNYSGQENEVSVSLAKQHGPQGQNENSIRLAKLYSWQMCGSVLGISYTLFERLVGDGVFRKMLLELPGLLVLDEGHTPRNDRSQIWKALSGVKTQKRIILSGTPFQNNFRELFNTLRLVRPKFADKIDPFVYVHRQGRKSSAARGKWDSLTSSIGKDSNNKLDKLKSMINPFVHVHKGSILKESLPGLRDSVVVLAPTHVEKGLIKVIQGRKNQLERYHLVSLISVNPSLLLKRLSEEEVLSIHEDRLERLRFDPKAGVKTKFIMELIRLSQPLKEKVLVFSQYTVPLTFLRKHLKSHFPWTEGKELLYMDGKCDAKQRQSSISLLNDPASEVQVLLASTKACCEGINLVGASRVVLLDVVWNPSVERQAISRAYRLGQKKIVYVYRLITSGTMEGEKYIRQAEKDRLSELLFSSSDGGVCRSEKISCTVSEDEILQEMVQHKKLSHMFEKILNQPKESDLIDTFGLVDL